MPLVPIYLVNLEEKSAVWTRWQVGSTGLINLLEILKSQKKINPLATSGKCRF